MEKHEYKAWLEKTFSKRLENGKIRVFAHDLYDEETLYDEAPESMGYITHYLDIDAVVDLFSKAVKKHTETSKAWNVIRAMMKSDKEDVLGYEKYLSYFLSGRCPDIYAPLLEETETPTDEVCHDARIRSAGFFSRM